MLDELITSKTRIKLLLKFFLNSNTTAYLRNLEGEFGESTNAIRVELNRFEKAGLIASHSSGNKKLYQANTNHPFYTDIHKLIMKYVGIDHIIEEVIEQVGNLKKAFITGDFAKGKTGKMIDIVLVGEDFNYDFLSKLIQKAESMTSLKIRYITVNSVEENLFIGNNSDALLIWNAEK